jgi:colanic acid biosynthesis protein WcaH
MELGIRIDDAFYRSCADDSIASSADHFNRMESKDLPKRAPDLQRLVEQAESLVPSPQEGLPDSVFGLLSRISPLVVVDLLIKNEDGQTLLTWRHDESYGPGWHVPGGIVRYKETTKHRIEEVARLELRARVEIDPKPITIEEFLRPGRNDRGHIVSMLFRCRLLTLLDDSLRFNPDAPRAGQRQWHRDCPYNLIREQLPYQPFIL